MRRLHSPDAAPPRQQERQPREARAAGASSYFAKGEILGLVEAPDVGSAKAVAAIRLRVTFRLSGCSTSPSSFIFSLTSSSSRQRKLAVSASVSPNSSEC